VAPALYAGAIHRNRTEHVETLASSVGKDVRDDQYAPIVEDFVAADVSKALYHYRDIGKIPAVFLLKQVVWYSRSPGYGYDGYYRATHGTDSRRLDIMNQKVRVLAGDIGGTKTRLALFDVMGDVMGDDTGTTLQTVVEEIYPSRDYQAFAEIAQLFLESHQCRCESACFGVAGPVRNGVAETTNLPWRLVAGDLGDELEITQVALLNDLEANAWGIQVLDTDDFCVLQDGDRHPAGNAAVIAAGTGLGEAGMYRDGRRYRPFGTEGGHTDFSPANELEFELLRFLRRQYAHVSWERVLSGPGLVNIHTFLRAYRSSEVPGWLVESMLTGDPAAAISQAALLERDEICVEALDLFVHFYGVEAGNLALKMMATGGVYLGGGIAPKIIEKLQGELFMQGFRSKGRMQHLLESMPVRVILNDRTALYGPAVFGALSAND